MITKTRLKTAVTLFVLMALFGISAYGVNDVTSFSSVASHAIPSAPEADFLIILGFGLIGLGVLRIRK
jgi:hypothetical protein